MVVRTSSSITRAALAVKGNLRRVQGSCKVRSERQLLAAPVLGGGEHPERPQQVGDSGSTYLSSHFAEALGMI